MGLLSFVYADTGSRYMAPSIIVRRQRRQCVHQAEVLQAQIKSRRAITYHNRVPLRPETTWIASLRC